MKREKQSNSHQIQRKTVLRWAVSYLPVLLIPLILGGLLYGYSMKAVQEKAETIQYTMLADRAETLASVFEQVSDLTIMIQGDSTVSQLAKKAEWTREDRYQMGEVQKLLSDYTRNNEEIEEIFLYFPQKECMIGTDLAFSVESNKVLERATGLDQDSFLRLLSEELYGTYHSIGENKLLYTSVFRKNVHLLKQPMIVLVYLSEQYLDYLLHTTEVEFFLADTQGNAYSSASYRAGEVGRVTIEEVLKTSFENSPMQWKGTTCLYQDEMERYGLKLYSIQPDVGYVSTLRGMRWILAAYLLICLLAGVLLVWYQSRRNYRPVGDLLTVIRRHGYLEGKELAEAGQSLQHLIDAYESRKDEVGRQEQVIITHGLHQLFEPDNRQMGAGDEATYQMFCSFLGGDIRQVVQFRVLGAEETGLEGTLLAFMLKNVLAEELERKVSFVFGELRGCYYLLAGERRDGKSLLAEEDIEKISRFFKEQCGIDVSVEISGLWQGWQGVARAYDEVRALAEYRGFLTGYPQVIAYETWKQEELVRQFYHIFAKERSLCLALREHQVGIAEKELASYKKALESEAMQLWLGVKEEPQEEATRCIADEVQEYIDGHYADKQLTVGALAEMFEVSTPWLSRNFKKEKDCGVLEYIGQVRMEHAKELLLSGMSVTETAEQVGYYSSRPLIRLFTERVGMTPMKYVKSQQ